MPPALCLYYGLNQTNMDNRFAFGLWIFLDLGDHRSGRGRVLHRIPRLYPETRRTEAHPEYRCGRRLHLLQRRDRHSDDRCRTAAARVVHLLASEYALDADGSYVLHHLLPPGPRLEYLPILLRNRQLRKLPSFLVFEFQLHKLVPSARGRGGFALVLSPGIAGRALWSTARPSVRFPARILHLAVHILSVHSFGDCDGTQLSHAGDRGRGESNRQATGAAMKYSGAWG